MARRSHHEGNFLGFLPSTYKTSWEEQEQALEISATHLVTRVDVGLGLDQRQD